VDLSGVAPEEAARRLTFHAVEVEETIARFGAGLDPLVTARVVAARPHPGADRLRLCSVDRGDGAPLEVVCGAPNVAAGQVVCFAPVGATLPGGLSIERRKIRGVESAGMICAEDEMGLGADHDGIVVLPEGTPIGRPLPEVLGLPDAVLEVSGTSITHRPDLWGHVGFARELAALLGRPLRPPTTARAEAALAAAMGPAFPVSIEDPGACRRYLGLLVEGVRNGPSPAWLRRRLVALGQRPIDLLVDLTNLVLLEQGQPLHAFDLARLAGGRIEVRSARAGERLTTLDGTERALDPTDLVIADGEKPVALAGVMGGTGTGCGPSTKALLLESACFDPVRVRRMSARHGLRTEASARFEKGLDPEGTLTAARRFLELLLDACPEARVTRALSDLYPRPAAPREVRLPYDLVRRRLGLRVADSAVRSSLAALGFRVVKEDHHSVLVSVPSWRATKEETIPEDLIEEVGRLMGYDAVLPVPPPAPMRPGGPGPARLLERRLAIAASLDLGWNETKSRAFCGPKDAERLGIPVAAHLALVHPLSEEESLLLLTTVANLLRQAERNQAVEPSGRLWESTRLVVAAGGRGGLPTEIPVLAAVAWEREGGEDPNGRLFLGLLADLRALVARVGATGLAWRDATDEDRLRPSLPPPAWLHTGRRAAFVREGRVVALAGEVRPSVARSFGVAGRAAWAEVDLEALRDVVAPALGGYEPVPRFPASTFDVAVVVPRRTPAAAVEGVIRGAAPREVREVTAFDVFEGPGLPSGTRSLAFTCTLLDPERTLSEEAARALRGRIVAALEGRGWSVRGPGGPGAG
jgi:phenylalanyl-tRNA synthetase beta chain